MIRLRSKTIARAVLLTIGVFAAIVTLPLSATAAPAAELWPMWQAHHPNSTQQVDHASWNEVLAEYRRAGENHDGIARFDYAAARHGGVRNQLKNYLGTLSGIDPRRLNRAEQRAYWVNLYNALTVAVVMDHFPVKSIRDISISPGLFSSGPWGKKLITIAGAEISLDDVEHRILRPIWRDARLHYVLNCASLGCPDLPEQAMTAANGEQMLDRSARRFINHDRGARVDAGGRLHVSSIYDWFQDDFGGSDLGVIRHLRTFAGTGLAGKLSTVRDIYDHAYDWRLNRPRP